MYFEPCNNAKTINHKILLVWVFNKAPSIHVTNIGSSLASQEIKPTNLQATRMTYSKRRREDLKLFSFLHWDKPFLKPHPQKVCHMHVKLKLQTRSQIFPTNFQNTVTHKSWPKEYIFKCHAVLCSHIHKHTACLNAMQTSLAISFSAGVRRTGYLTCQMKL